MRKMKSILTALIMGAAVNLVGITAFGDDPPFDPLSPSGASHSIVVIDATVSGVPLTSADWVGVIDDAGITVTGATGEVVVAAAPWAPNLSLSAAISVTPPVTGATPTPGAVTGHTMKFMIFDASAEQFLAATATIGLGPATFAEDFTIVATLAATAANASDVDGDGLPDSWEIAQFGNLTTTDDPNGDFDGDSETNFAEFANGTNPADSRSAHDPANAFGGDGSEFLLMVTRVGAQNANGTFTATGAEFFFRAPEIGGASGGPYSDGTLTKPAGSSVPLTIHEGAASYAQTFAGMTELSTAFPSGVYTIRLGRGANPPIRFTVNLTVPTTANDTRFPAFAPVQSPAPSATNVTVTPTIRFVSPEWTLFQLKNPAPAVVFSAATGVQSIAIGPANALALNTQYTIELTRADSNPDPATVPAATFLASKTISSFTTVTEIPPSNAPFFPVAPSGRSHSIVILNATINGVALESGDWVAVVDEHGVTESGTIGETEAAAAQWQANLSLAAVLSVVPTSGAAATPGAVAGHPLLFRVYDHGTEQFLPATATIGLGPSVFAEDFTLVTLLQATAVNTNDMDADGLSDSWEQQIIDASSTDDIDTIDDVRPGEDFDGDGITNGFEFASNTNPTNATDNPLRTLDVDGNGSADALTDGMLVLRYLFGFQGTALTDGAVALGAPRHLPADIQEYLSSMLPPGN